MMLCVPNVSEGRRLEVVASMADAIRRAAVRALLDVSSDAAHNRSVFTLAGDPAALAAAVLALVERAVLTIDLRTHRGQHPRLGAVDVVPFVPLGPTPMAECVALARQVGAAIADRFRVPVYLYEEAAATPARKALEHIRRGGFEGLAARMALPEWAPDFGPRRPHPTAGATVVGARGPLVAYNINLSTSRLDLARRIASAIRSSGGGLPYVKAMGVALEDEGLVQVSMNLTNFRETPVAAVFEAVAREAARDGVAIHDSEIVGLVPQAALAGVAPAALKLRNFGPDRILETNLELKTEKGKGQ